MTKTGAFVVGLAPMEGVTGFAARVFFRLTGAPDTLATPFLRITDTFPAKALPLNFAPEFGTPCTGVGACARNLIVQFMAVEADDFLRAAALVHDKTDFIEINCGCPSPVVVGKGAGSSLLKDVDDFHRMIRRLQTALGPGRLAVKMRTGYASADEFPDLLAGLTELPLARLTVHGRTRPDGYRGRARWDLIASAASRSEAPVVASGDIVDLSSLTALRGEAPDASAAVIGRGALRNPWVFEEIRRGTPTILPYQALRCALLSFALLHDLGRERVEALAERVMGEDFSASAGANEERWLKVVTALAPLSPAHPGASWPFGDAAKESEWTFDRTTVGRLKLLWNYLRSSLPSRFFAPTVLRARSVGELLTKIDALAAEEAAASGVRPTDLDLTLTHQAGHDWLYSGQSRQAGPAGAK